MYRRYYSYNDMPQMVRPSANKEAEKPKEKPPEAPAVHKKQKEQKKFLDKLETDDIILVVVALLLLMDECDDKLLILAIGFIFLSGLFDN